MCDDLDAFFKSETLRSQETQALLHVGQVYRRIEGNWYLLYSDGSGGADVGWSQTR